MDCIEVQQLLSQAIDGEPVSRERIAEARAHCATCASCAQFVRGLALVHRTPPPAEPAGLADRVVAAVRQEAERASAASAAAVASPTAAAVGGTRPLPGGPIAVDATEHAGRRRPSTPRRRMSPVTVGAWIGAAAAVLIIAVFAAAAGVRSIVQGPTDASLSSREAEGGFMTTPSTADQSQQAPSTSGSGVTKEATGTAGAARVATEARMIAVGGYAYRLLGATPTDRSKLTTYSATTTSLDSDSPPQTYTVYKTSTGGRVAILQGEKTLLFEIVRRSYEKRAYALTTGPLPSFGVWPALPGSIPTPTTPSGAPTFLAAGLDETGTEVYKLPTTPVSQGIAVPPGTPQSDPSGGDPEWTWWTPPPL